MCLNQKGKNRLALNFLIQIRKFRRSVEHLNESFLSFDPPNKIDHKVSEKLEKNLISEPIKE